MKLVLLIVVFFLAVSVRSANCYCTNFSLLENSLLNNENLERLTSEFFPTDHPARTVVDIDYVVTSVYAREEEGFAIAEEKHLISVDDSLHRLGRVLKGFEDESEIDLPQSETLHFRWIASSINMFVDPTLLNKLSLYTFQPVIGNITFYLETECKLPSNYTCESKDKIIELLNQLTSNMLFYAKDGKNKGSLDVSQEKRYSVMFEENGTYCVVNQTAKYHELQKMLTASTIVLVVFLTLATPTIFVGIYDRLQTKMKYGLLISKKEIKDGVKASKKKKEKNLQFFVWATVIVASLLVVAMLTVNGLFITNHSQSNSPSTIIIIYYVFCGLVPLVNIPTVILGMCCIWKGKRSVTDFPIPHIFCIYCCTTTKKSVPTGTLLIEEEDKEDKENKVNEENKEDKKKEEDSENEEARCGKYARFVFIFLALYFFSLFLNLLGFHSVYIILGTIASPVVAMAHIAFYITAFLCLVAFMALFLKFTNKSRCDTKSQSFCWAIIQYSPPVVAAFILVVCVLGFGCFYYLFITLVKDYQHKGDFLSILGTFLPSALLTFFAYCGNKLVNCMSAEKIDCGITTDIAEVESKDDDKKNGKKKITDAEGKTDTSPAGPEVKTAAGPEGKAVVKDVSPDIQEVEVVYPAASSSASSEGLEIGSN